MITRRHFEIGLKEAKKTVNDTDLSKYDDFKRKFDPSFHQGNEEVKIRWPDDGEEAQKKNDIEDDLYS
jgi:transitional endoplasmic reticulum ATPase